MKLNITITYGDTVYVVETYQNEYRSLMMLIYDQIGPDEFGECLGMGKCATCLIEVIDPHAKLTAYDRNEFTTLNKYGLSNTSFRLSCQILIDENINGLKFKIL